MEQDKDIKNNEAGIENNENSADNGTVTSVEKPKKKKE